jgi:hypothetical protein
MLLRYRNDAKVTWGPACGLVKLCEFPPTILHVHVERTADPSHEVPTESDDTLEPQEVEASVGHENWLTARWYDLVELKQKLKLRRQDYLLWSWDRRAKVSAKLARRSTVTPTACGDEVLRPSSLLK